MWGSAEEKPAEEDVEEKYPVFGDLADSISKMPKDEARMIIDNDGEIWCAVWNGEKLSVTPAAVTKIKVDE